MAAHYPKSEDLVRSNPDLQKKVGDYVERVLKEESVEEVILFKSRGKPFPYVGWTMDLNISCLFWHPIYFREQEYFWLLDFFHWLLDIYMPVFVLKDRQN